MMRTTNSRLISTTSPPDMHLCLSPIPSKVSQRHYMCIAKVSKISQVLCRCVLTKLLEMHVGAIAFCCGFLFLVLLRQGPTPAAHNKDDWAANYWSLTIDSWPLNQRAYARRLPFRRLCARLEGWIVSDMSRLAVIDIFETILHCFKCDSPNYAQHFTFQTRWSPNPLFTVPVNKYNRHVNFLLANRWHLLWFQKTLTFV